MLRDREWLEEMTTSGAVPEIIGKRSSVVIRKERPDLINFMIRKKSKRLVKRSSQMSLPLQNRI